MDPFPFWRLYAAPPAVRVLIFLFLFSAWHLNLKFPRPVQPPAYHRLCVARVSAGHTTTPLASVSVPPPPLLYPPPAYSTASTTETRQQYTRDQLLSINTAISPRLKPDVIAHLKDLGVGYKLPRGKRSSRGGTRKHKEIRVLYTDRRLTPTPQHADENRVSLPSILSDVTTLPTRPPGSNPSNLITVPLQHIDSLHNQLCVCVFNAQSVGPSTKRSSICDFVRDKDVDVLLLTETWLRHSGDEAKCRDLTPPGYTLTSIPRQHDTNIKRGGGHCYHHQEPSS